MLRMVSVWTSSSFGLCEPTQLSSLLYSLFFSFSSCSPTQFTACLFVQARQQITSLETIRLRRTMHIFTISAKQGFYCKTKHAFKSNVIFARKCL